ncbi:hypothetical protein F5884DRAFT_69713 [Xylogone sp. PMI_703]|nr:hypothetical protein F5884DRAFT_69713 [Xylogone sp. PMI_703]
MHSFNASERRQPFQIATNSSTNSSTVTVQPIATPSQSRALPATIPRNAPFAPHAVNGGLTDFSNSVTTSRPRRRSSTTHSRSSSLGGGKDGLVNLDRWSQSTISSKGSVQHKRSSSFGRRLSFSGAGTFNFGSSGSTGSQHQSPSNKLQKSRPSTANSPSGPPATRPPIEPPPNPQALLPPIVTLPHLQQGTSAGSTPLTGTPGVLTPSTAGLLSAAAHSVVPDYFGGGWENSPPTNYSRTRSSSKSKVIHVDHSQVASSGPSTNGSAARRPSASVDANGSQSRGHSRNRSHAGKGSTDTGSSRDRGNKPPSQKAMLSKALQKANTAVLLDNAQNYEGAMLAYSEACELLHQVMLRTAGDDDRGKLEAIRNTYTNRIEELEKMASDPDDDGKALPARPESFYRSDDMQLPDDEDEDDEEPAIIETATVTRIVNDDSYMPELQNRSIAPEDVPRRRESLLPSAFDQYQYKYRSAPQQSSYDRSYSKPAMQERIVETNLRLAPPYDPQYMPPPLSPRRARSPNFQERPSNYSERLQPYDSPDRKPANKGPNPAHMRAPSNESMSWLDTIDESGASSASSVHSRTSSLGVRRKRIRAASGATEAEFDAALDAAVEAAYDDGFEPAEDSEAEPESFDYDDEDEVIASVRRRVELAKERVRQTEREAALQEAQEEEKMLILQRQDTRTTVDTDTRNESEEEERILEEMTRGFVMDEFEFGLQSKSSLPRESDSSGFSGRTWNSSIVSNPNTAGTALSTVTEDSAAPQVPPPKTPPSTYPPPPSQALPQPPPLLDGPPPTPQSVRARRLSGQNAKQLKIETSVRELKEVPEQVTSAVQPASMPPTRVPPQPKTAGLPQRQPLSAASNRPPVPQSARQTSSPFHGPSPSDAATQPASAIGQTLPNDSQSSVTLPQSGSPGRSQSRAGIRKNFSSSSLKNMRARNPSISNLDDEPNMSPITPSSSHFNLRDPTHRLPAMPSLPTPIATAFKEKLNVIPSGGLHLFNNDIHSPEMPGSPNPLTPDGPIPLEPCPNEFLLRPFWLMRALYQTIAHPKGGYLSTKLFVPRDVWQVKGVKIKAVEDKITNCDFLTAALLKLSKVDTFDADAVLEEMQSLETILEQVQATLTKKLGNEVGVQGSGSLFKEAAPGTEAEASNSSKTASVSSKSSFSWRRLRSKNSAAALSSSYVSKTASIEAKDGLATSTLPMMTSSIKPRFAKRDVNQVQFSGPNANYMGALARLFDAAQTIDQIARQVEDPGLKHADKTQVGLELCTRHAAEFFAFYICRFVLTDIGLLLDKFIKRGSEWVLV